MGDDPSRKLAVILHADVVGSTTLVQQNEALAHARIRDAFRRLSSTIEAYDGVTCEIRGDALVAELQRASDAVVAALAFQKENIESNARLGDDLQVRLRIGVSLGEVVIADRTVTGAGVVLAQRVEQLAEPSGVCVTEAIHEAVPRHLPLEYSDLGKREVKGFREPVHVYSARAKAGGRVPSPERASSVQVRSPHRRHRWTVGGIALLVVVVVSMLAWWQSWRPEELRSRQRPAFALQDKPSIAVLPFENLSGDSEQEYFSDGLTEDLITDLSQISGLIVIARNSSFAYKGQAVDVKKIGRELGARYILEGSVRKAVNRVRINAKLVETATGSHLWAQRYDRDLTDVLALQDEVTRTIVSALAVNLTRDEQAQLETPRSVSPDAYDVLLRGNERLQRYTPEDLLEARALYEQAIALDPNYARAHANVAYTYAVGVLFGWVENDEEWIRAGVQAAERALALHNGIPQIHFTLANLYSAQGRPESAVDSARRSIELDPNYADGYGMLAVALTFTGDLDEALTAIDTGMRLNPRHSYMYLWVKGRILFHLERYEEAAAILEESVRRNPTFDQGRMILAATYAQMGRMDDAERQAEELLTLRPDFTIANEERQIKYKRPADETRLLEALRKTGLPR